jgi:hypothetical protein
MGPLSSLSALDLIAIFQSSYFLQIAFVGVFERAIQIKLSVAPMPDQYLVIPG